MNVIGVHTSPGHDMGACLLQDGIVRCVIEEERLSLVKHALPNDAVNLWPQYNGCFGYFPWASFAYCLDEAKLSIDDLDAVVVPAFSGPAFAQIVPIRDKRKILIADEPKGAQHHFMHALSAFFASDFEQAAVLVVDGDGSMIPGEGYEAESGYAFDDRSGAYRTIFKNRYLERGIGGGIGWMYDVVSAALGFVNTRIGYLADPGKTMGLAPYGRSREGLSAPWIRVDGFRLDLSGFNDWARGSGIDKIARYEDRSRALIQDESHIPDYAMDLAFKAQAELERAMLALSVELHRSTGKKNLCLAGGVALNSVANGLISAQGPFERLFVQPAAGDGGQSIGLAYYGHLKLRSDARIKPIAHAFAGRLYDENEVESMLRAAGLGYRKLDDEQSLADDAAEALASGQIVGWFQGGSEYGPRALGHRSILADPRPTTMKDHLNRRVKFRELFRPFAPSVLAERAHEVFDLRQDSPYMLLVAPVRAEWRDRVPAITHIDGTARVQTVDPNVDNLYARLIEAFHTRTGIPLVLNTSFNLRGMPIVESPRDALRAFLFTDMDRLYLGRLDVKRPDPLSLTPALSPEWTLNLGIAADWRQREMVSRGAFVLDGGKRSVTLSDLPRLDGADIPAQDEVNVVGRFVFALDGETSIADALKATVSEEVNQSLARSADLLVQALLRHGILRLRIGSVEL